ncbi:hypothetical protein bthur0010_12340 [Bacillus thuringiensis serovar pondicheriensis BGSC 4BA1]|nr:hypothetical protein bthur0010_12340 [Bacillus thuringiensis serovar pondicheriensis BGSC 4BA1]
MFFVIGYRMTLKKMKKKNVIPSKKVINKKNRSKAVRELYSIPVI